MLQEIVVVLTHVDLQRHYGLKKSEDLNGQIGKVERNNLGDGRHAVCLDGGETAVSIKAGNLEPRKPTMRRSLSNTWPFQNRFFNLFY